jgi:hypothetical protein
MYPIIDLATEFLIDRSRIQNPYVRLLVTALGRELAKGSAWVAVDKEVLSNHKLLARIILGRVKCVAA